MSANPVTIDVDGTHTVSGLLQIPGNAFACYVLAHGAGAGMNHRFMTAVADGLCDRGVATLRFQFPAMEIGLKRPDRPALAQATVRSTVNTALRLTPGMPLFAGGKSFGSRMTSQAQAQAPLPNILGLLFLGFPLHPANKPGDERAHHLAKVRIPMLFVQGARDLLAETALLVPMIGALGSLAALHLIEHADHSFHVPARSATTDQHVLAQALDASVRWIQMILRRSTHDGA